MTDKIIFLDIDGVLNSVDSSIAFYKWMPRGTKIQMEDRLDSVSIGLLRRLCIETGAKIVISSTWRMGRTESDFVEIFARHGWEDFPIVGLTPIGHTLFEVGHRERGQEIQYWLDHNGNPEYIILDDDSDMLDSQMSRFIHCSNVNGFRSKHYCQALRLFGQADERLEYQVNWTK